MLSRYFVKERILILVGDLWKQSLKLPFALVRLFNTRLNVVQLKLLNDKLTDIVRSIFNLYKSTTQSVIYLPREMGDIGIKKVSDVYYVTRSSFLIKMLNHDIPDFKFFARGSLKRDMTKRGVPISNLPINFLGYAIENNGYLNPITKFGGISDWLELSRYVK